jgi:hypothetical protein
MDIKGISTLNPSSTQSDRCCQERRAALGGLLCRRECWTLSWRGWLLALVLIIGLLAAMRYGAYPFLTVTDRVPAEVLVIEGWSPPSTMRQAASEFLHGGYRRALLVRPVLETGDQYESGHYSADFVTRMLIADGVPGEKLSTLFPNVARKDRTFHSALAVQQWLKERGMHIQALDVATAGPHSRRSRLMYQKAFGDGVKIGVIALDNPEYDPKRWWRTSEGVRDVVGESIAYLYARVLFHPSNPAIDLNPGS